MKAWAWALRAAASIVGPARVRLAVGDVVGHRVVEQQDLLRHQAEPQTQIAEPHVADVDAVDRDPAGDRIVEPRQQLHERGLAAAVGADDGHRFAGPHFELNVAQHRLVRVVVEVDVLERDRLRERRQRLRIGRIDDRRLAVEHFVDAVGGGRGLLDVAEFVATAGGPGRHAGQHREEDAHLAVRQRRCR